MAGDFSVPIINVVGNHTDETRKILLPLSRERKGTDYIRKALCYLAKQKGYNLNNVSIPDDILSAKLEAERKTEKIDYTYVSAFFWLRQLEEYKAYSKARIIRESILSFANQ